MAFIKNNTASVRIGLNAFFAIVSGYFLIVSDLFKANPWYLVIIYSIISLVVIMLLWLFYRLLYRGTKAAIKKSPDMIKRVPGKVSNKHQTKQTKQRTLKRGARK